jgi:diguanylate cyclase (GGDEF)-like protein/PAS domain S-box-containing protein
MTKARILIVEDEQIVAMDIQNTLESNGFIVVGQTDNGEDAILRTMELKPDLILMDINLKGELDGIESAIQIRAQFDLPVIFLTAYGNPTIVERARLAEPFGYIFKPFEERELISNIQMALYKHEMERKVRESEIKFRALIEHGRDNISLLSTDGKLLWESPSVIHTLGYEQNQHLERNIFELMHPDDLAWTREVFGRVIQKPGNSEEGIFRLLRSDGSWRWIEATATNLLHEPTVQAIIVNYRDVTERRQAEERSMQFLDVLEASLNEIYIFDPQTFRFEYVNEGARHNLGYPMEQLLALTALDIKPEFSEAAFRKMVEPLLLHEKNKFVFQTSHRRADGSLYPVEVHLQLVERGSRALFLAFINDITERKRAEEILLVKEAAIASSINAIAMSDLHGRLNYVNEAFLKMWGFDHPAEVLEKPVIAFWDDREQAKEVTKALFDKGNWVGEMTAIRRDNSRFEAQVSAHLVKGTDGQPVCMMASFLDITERKKAEAELRKLSQAVEQSANAIVITNTEGNIEYANPKFVEVSGYSLSETLRETPRILNSGEHSPEFYRNLWQTIKAGRVWRGEIHNRRKDGTLYWEDSTITPVFDSDHKLVNFIAIKEDITARKALEEAERSHRRLAEALRDTSAALNSTLKLDEVLDRVLENIEKVTTFDAAMVLMVEGHTVRKIRQLNKLQTILSPGLTGNTQANLINVPILQTIRETQQPCLIPDIRTDLRWHAIPGMSWIRSLISAPVMIRGQVAGVINILSATPNAFTPSHSERLMVFAGQAAVAIENAQLFEQAYYLSVIDPLTELTNRRHFFEVARFEFERTHRYPRTLSVMMIDIDHFKNINDTHGHAVGDAALREVAARIKRSVRTVDIVARYGGEEFIVLMPETGLQEAGRVAERVCNSVANRPIVDDPASVSATLSIGVAEMDENSKNMDQLIVYADKALYDAKAAGRNRVAVYRNA